MQEVGQDVEVRITPAERYTLDGAFREDRVYTGKVTAYLLAASVYEGIVDEVQRIVVETYDGAFIYAKPFQVTRLASPQQQERIDDYNELVATA